MEVLPRELALRIALASRILPGIDVPRLLEILHERVLIYQCTCIRSLRYS